MTELTHDAGPELTPVARRLLSLTNDTLDMFTLFAMRLSWIIMVL